jgi:threonine/homoserine/homoserine lactone efflux protein
MLSLLFLICAIIASVVGTGAALYIAWCARKAREHAKPGVEWWKLGASSRALEDELYEPSAALWLRRAQKAQAIIPLAFFLALGLYVLSSSQR